MPTIGSFHSFYWDGSRSTSVGVLPGGRVGGYPTWQASVIAPSLFGIVAAWIDVQIARLRWAWRLLRRVRALDPERRAVLERVLDTLDSPVFPIAREAVRETATTLGFNRPEAWQGLSRAIKASPGRAENTFRHLNACTLLKDTARAHGSTLTNPEMHLTVELAYQGFAAMGR